MNTDNGIFACGFTTVKNTAFGFYSVKLKSILHSKSKKFSISTSLLSPSVTDYTTLVRKRKQNLARNIIILSKVYTNKGDIKQLYHGLSACTRDDPLAKARGLSPRTDGQTMV